MKKSIGIWICAHFWGRALHAELEPARRQATTRPEPCANECCKTCEGRSRIRRILKFGRENVAAQRISICTGSEVIDEIRVNERAMPEHRRERRLML